MIVVVCCGGVSAAARCTEWVRSSCLIVWPLLASLPVPTCTSVPVRQHGLHGLLLQGQVQLQHSCMTARKASPHTFWSTHFSPGVSMLALSGISGTSWATA